jgi:integrase
MASLLRPWITRYLDAEGRQVGKGTPGAKKARRRGRKWYAQYLGADGKRKRVPLCTDKAAALQMLAGLERDAQRQRAGLVDRFAEHRQASVDAHVADYEVHLRNKGVSTKHLSETLRRLQAVLQHGQVRCLTDLRPEAVEQFLAGLAENNASARTRNTYLASAKAFGHWCLRTRRLGEDVLGCLQAAAGDAVRQRRSLPENELARLLQAARERPLREVMILRTGKRKGEACANVRPEVRARLERLGWERSLIYKVGIMTGLRRSELEALEVRHLTLAGPRPCVALAGADTKNRQGADLPLRADLAEDLKCWVEATGKTASDKLFRVPVELVKILKRDLQLAGIPYKDAYGRVFDAHSLRHTTASFLGKGKVTPRLAQGFMRHSDIKLTLQTYADPSLLDEAEALAALPRLPLLAGGGQIDTQGEVGSRPASTGRAAP